MFTFRSFALASVVALTCCSEQAAVTTTSSEIEGKLSIDSLNDYEFTGSYDSDVGTVKFVAFVESDTKISAVAFVNDTQIDLYATSEDDGHVGFRVHGGELDEKAHILLDRIHVELADRFPYPEEGAMLDESPQHVGLLRNYLGFLSEAPMRMQDDIIDTRIGREPKVIRMIPDDKTPTPTQPTPTPAPACSDVPDNDGVTILPTCCRGGGAILFQHDDLPGGHCFMTLAGTCGTSSPSGCVGRCGPGCNAGPGYYQDCVDHDLCLDHEGGGSGITPAGKCGDEWWEAVDDFAFAYSAAAPLFWWLRTGSGPCS
jgi:hypothetical protein